ncbi:SUMO-interacting motif-containing protein 1 isoform X2 [Eleutherodactylus coqui]|uniref:SUMO-interacting motif-containing protein 1 isoform X2 n=1 Tax=Eleutherodactylus coqui TaxID=57060 RepID=UPI003462C74F
MRSLHLDVVSAGVIDLTNGDVFTCVTSSDDNLIDLTRLEDYTTQGTFEQQVNSKRKYKASSRPEGGESDPREGNASSTMNSQPCNSEDWQSEDKPSESYLRGACKRICTAESMMDFCQPDDGLPGNGEVDLPSNSNLKLIYVNASRLPDLSDEPSSSHVCAHSEIGTQVQHITSSTPAIQEDSREHSCSQSTIVNSPFFYKLRYFKKRPVSHLFPHMLKYDKNLQAAPMPLSRTNLVNNTKDEGFHRGTLYFLSEFVSASHYPPKDIISHVLSCVLLGAEERAIQHEAYMILMKVQRLHPATLESVAWDWRLLSEVMSEQDSQTCCLFLQYVVQTLDDDFHFNLQRRSLHKCLCKSMLSCDKSFCNVKEVLHWLIDAVNNLPETGHDSSVQCNLQRAVFLLQRMLSIAVEVDNSPTVNSNRIAHYVFPYVTVLKTRQKREMFFNSTENSLLRAKILEILFHNGCESPPPPQFSLCFGNILYFISNSTLQLENQGLEWQRWDEMLHYTITLCLSLQTIIADHLRTPITDRSDEMLRRPQSRMYQAEDITESEVDLSLTVFQQRSSPGAEPAAALLSRLFLLRSLLHAAVKR